MYNKYVPKSFVKYMFKKYIDIQKTWFSSSELVFVRIKPTAFIA